MNGAAGDRNDLVGLPAPAPRQLALRMQAEGHCIYKASDASGVPAIVLRDVLEHLPEPGEPDSVLSEAFVRLKEHERIMSYIAYGADPGEAA